MLVLKTKEFKTSRATGVDNLAEKFLKDGLNILCAPIVRICNLSIKFASFPDKCKVAKIKRWSQNWPKNFRLISPRPLISKIVEQIIHDQTNNFLSGNNVLYKYQSNFRKVYWIDTGVSMTKSQKFSILVSWREWFLLIYKRRSIQLTTKI